MNTAQIVVVILAALLFLYLHFSLKPNTIVLFFNGKAYKKGDPMQNFSVDKPITVSLVEDDQFGNAEASQIAPDSAPSWTVDNSALATIAASADGMSAVITPLGPVGVLTVSVAASFGGKAINGQGQIQLVAGAVASVALQFSA